MALCDAGRGGDGCEGCRGWSRQSGEGEKSGAGKSGAFRSFAAHPDLTVVGELGKAGNIESCRALVKELMLKPVVAKRRLGVVLAADKLLIHAANSLLKVAEEPPSHACLLFLLEGNDFLPTLRSRSRFTTLAAPLSFAAVPVPKTEEEWLGWLKNAGKPKEEDDIPEFLSSWTSSLLERGELESAARVEKLRLLVLQKKLSQTMTCDLLILALKEELPFEHTFGGVW
jgi:DNA polymerase-3 subunit delta'